MICSVSQNDRQDMAQLNFHHLRYFWAVAKEGNLTRAARQLHVSQSALSAQIKQLEGDLGQQLFHRTGRSLTLTEAGQVALAYADSIFAAGNELVEVLREGRRAERQVLRIGAVATASRNFQENFIRPVLDRDDVELVLVSGSLPELLSRLRVHSIDLVLCNQRVHASATDPWRCRRIARQPVSLVGRPDTVPDHVGDDRRTAVGNDHHPETICQGEFLHRDIEGQSRPSKAQHQQNTGHYPQGLGSHKVSRSLANAGNRGHDRSPNRIGHIRRSVTRLRRCCRC